MKTPTKKAAGLTAAMKNKLPVESYPKTIPLSIKIQIGQFLLLLLTENGQPDAWQRFERLLRQLYTGGVL